MLRAFLMVKRKALLFSDFLGGNQRPRWGRSAGPDFSPMRNRGKNRQRRGLPPPCGIHPRQRRGLPPPCGIHPAVLGAPASFSFQPLAWWGHIDSSPFYGLDLLLCSCILLPPGPYPGEPLFPANGGLVPGGGNAAHRGEALETGAPSHREGNAFHRLARPSM